MIKVRILAGLAGETWRSGEVLDLPVDHARQLIAEQRAEQIDPEPRPQRPRRKA